jgi:two-component system LytT family response regulator
VTPTAVVVDDDPLARERLRDLAAEVPLVELIGEAADAETGVRVIDELKPDVVFLDIEMPAGSGLDVARRMRHPAAVVFTTAYQQYAVTAFELSAVDYLLKPFGAERFREAVERAIASLSREAPESRAERIRSALEQGPRITRLFLRERDAILPVPVERILRIEAEGDYVNVHTRERVHLVRLRLQDLEGRLGDRFLRVHRSHLVNLDHVKLFEHHDDTRLVVVMNDGTRVLASRTRSRELRRLAR